MGREDIEQKFAAAGWALDRSFEDLLIIGFCSYGISLMAHKEWWGTEDPLFELLDHEGIINYWVREVPTPEQAHELLRKHARQAQEWDQP